MITKAVIELLVKDAGVKLLVNERIYPNIIKADAVYPAVYVSCDQMQKPNCIANSKSRIGTIEVGVYANTYGETYKIIEAIRSVLDDYNGTVVGVGISIRRGHDMGDKYDTDLNKNIKIIEYEAAAQIHN